MKMILMPLVLLLIAGGDGGYTFAQPNTETASDERERLSAGQLAAYVPERAGPFPPVPDSYSPEEYADLEDSTRVLSAVTIDYKSPLNRSSGSGSFDVRVRVADWVDWPELAENMVTTFESIGEGTTEQWDGQRIQTRMEDGTLVIEHVREGDFAELQREMLIDGRFQVLFTAKPGSHSELGLDDLRVLLAEMYETSRLPELGEAPLYADAEPVSGPPSWLGGEGEPQALAEFSCDAVLPIDEVERVCGGSGVRAVDTGMASEGDCNRIYKRGDAVAGFVFLLTRYEQAETARRALGVAVGTDREAEVRPLPDLAGGGYSFVSPTGEARVAFVVANALVELKASDSPIDAPDQKLCLERDQVEEIARAVADRLAN